MKIIYHDIRVYIETGPWLSETSVGGILDIVMPQSGTA